MKITILGLGNSVLTDDAVGLKIAERVEQLLPEYPLPDGWSTEVCFDEAGGWEILNYVEGADILFLVDSILDEKLGPGELSWYPKKVFTSPRMCGVHNTDIFSAMKFAQKQGLKVPEDLHILGVGVDDVQTFSEDCTPKVTACIEPAARQILDKMVEIAV
jgi:hydrogenase maturation protease